ncbi:MAG: hypothetical protein JXA89_24435, partial [Anaerolineae bacterium]|nr:hypothetical protein [Anaerolineae bacterium]
WMDGIDVEPDTLLAGISAAITTLQNEPNHTERQALLGDMLFEISNLARKWGIDAESALREANNRFELRFRRWEIEHNETQASSSSKTRSEPS